MSEFLFTLQLIGLIPSVLYIGSTAVSLIVPRVIIHSILKQLKKEHSLDIETVDNYKLQLADFIAIIPVINLLYSIILLKFRKEVSDYAKKVILERENIHVFEFNSADEQEYEAANEEEKVIENALVAAENIVVDDNSVEHDVVDYENMSTEEKIAYLKDERAALLNQGESFEVDSLDESYGERGPVLKKTFKPDNKHLN